MHMKSLLLYVDSVSRSVTVYLLLRSIIEKFCYVALPKTQKAGILHVILVSHYKQEIAFRSFSPD